MTSDSAILDLIAQLPSTSSTLLVLGLISLGPVLAIIATSYLKISVVLRLVRNAIGVQDVPPNLAVSALALILSMYIMAPLGMQITERLTAPGVNLGNITAPETRTAIADSSEPLRRFLERHAASKHRAFFSATANRIWGDELSSEISDDDLVVLIPAFTTSQLASAFETAFLLFLPFVAIDLIVSNVLLSLGMIMLSPLTISLPFKLLLFVAADGWTRLIESLVLSYQ